MAKILIVDDEPHIVELEKGILESEGFETIEATSGEEALNILENETPNLVLLDMMMPGMSGREVCEKIRKNPKTHDLNVAFVTVARFSEMGKDVLTELNVLDYITKPFENEDLIARVKKIVDK